MSLTSAAKDFRSSVAAVLSAAQNSGSSDSEVRWPLMLSERLSSLFALVAIERFLGFFIQQDG